MDKAPELLSVLQGVMEFADKLGVPGFVALIFAGPVLIVVALFALEWFRHRDEMRREEARRAEQKEYFAFIRDLQDQHSKDIDKQLRDLAAKHTEVVEFYNENVGLVKQYQRLATDFRDVVINNTRAVEHLTSIGQANFFCPVAREKATGKQ